MGHQHPKDALKLDKYPPPILPPYSLMKAWRYYKQNRPYNDWGVIAAISYSPKTAQQIANRMMTNDDIKNRIAELQSTQKCAVKFNLLKRREITARLQPHFSGNWTD